MTRRTASCSCGQLTAVASDDPVRVSIGWVTLPEPMEHLA